MFDSDGALRVEGISAGYGGTTVLHSVDLSVTSNEIVAVLGPNGAGKTTLLRAISKIIPISGGSVQFAETDTAKVSTRDLVTLGMAHVPEGRRLFGAMTVEENMLLGAHARGRSSVRERLSVLEGEFPILRERKAQKASSMSGGEQQMLAIARALMSGPRLLLLDEPSIGLAPRIVTELGRQIRGVVERTGCGVVLVEQNVNFALSVASRIYVLQRGRIVFEGDSASVDVKDLHSLYLD